MALNIKNREVERLATEVARLAKETKTEAIRRALLERKARLRIRPAAMSRRDRLEALLRNQIWSEIPADVRGKSLTKEEEERTLGYGSAGV
ncbi:MAG TPA: type II toxin-antitoxin system VapB family antitoxin [Bryobacteraceae bacterium]|nr:type II toxin-antitoxin system VapB family antitoxin [Bryobacteraceae bacterium]